jgi:Fic family protein
MSGVEKRVWSDGASGRSRRDRQPCQYEIYIPDKLLQRKFSLDGAVAADVAEAEAAVVRFNAVASSLVNTEALARILLRAESVASSRIEGLRIGARCILRAEIEPNVVGTHPDLTAKEVLANIAAMDYGIRQIALGKPITLELILEIHKQLLTGTELKTEGGKLREEQNWIGGSDYNPCTADFVPPRWESVPQLMEDLVAFCNNDDLPTIAQAAIAHAQFETIHPFVDGNGRTGRVLIQLILRRRGLALRVVPPVSLILATWAQDYVDGLAATRYLADPTSKEAHEGINLWIGRFAAACTRSVEDAMEFEARASSIEKNWRATLGRVRLSSSVDRLLQKLVGMPVLTVNTAMALTNTSYKQTNEAISTLIQAGILHPMSTSSRNRTFEAPQIIATFVELERQLASPQGDTRASHPSRTVPARPQKN